MSSSLRYCNQSAEHSISPLIAPLGSHANLTAAQWAVSDGVLLVTFLQEHHAALGDGGNFKMATFQAAVTILKVRNATGGLKTAKACQNKWASVCIYFPIILIVFSDSFVAVTHFLGHSSHLQPHRMELVQQK